MIGLLQASRRGEELRIVSGEGDASPVLTFSAEEALR
jgi:hypothetical protein